MPFLRVLRDKRGYETTYLMHWFRDGQRQRSRILYVFRTPPGVRVGRPVFEPAVVRELEERHPEIEFDWRSLLENQQVVDASLEPRRPRKRRREEGEPPAAAVPEASPPREEPAARPARPVAEAAAPASPARPSIPSVMEGETRDDQIAWLRQWYPIIRERIPHRTHDPVRREALYALAERLNPEPWTEEDAIVLGLQGAPETLARLSRVFSKRRRRPRRTPRRENPGQGPADT